jgi:uncharacterized membrane protein
MTSRWKRASPWVLAGSLTAVGVAHFVAPKPFVRIIPRALPRRELLNAAAGAAELGCAALVANPRTRRFGGWATAALFVAVFPANVQMALDSGRGSGLYRAGAWARLPLQVPLVWWAANIARSAQVRPLGTERSPKGESSK